LQGLFFCHKRTTPLGSMTTNILTLKGSHVSGYLVPDGNNVLFIHYAPCCSNVLLIHYAPGCSNVLLIHYAPFAQRGFIPTQIFILY
jgi:hypothetical protein